MSSRRRKISRDKRNGQYYVRIQVEGVRKYFALGSNRKLAAAELTKLEMQLADGTLGIGAIPGEVVPAPVTAETGGGAIMLKRLITVHLDWMETNRAESTCQMRAHYATAFLRYAGDRPVSEIDKLTLAGFQGWARKYHGDGPNGGNIYLRNVKTMLLWAEDMEICRCPVRKFPFMPEVPPLTKRFTDEELTRLLARVGRMAPDFHDMLVLALLTGLRPQEIRALERHHYMQPEVGREYLEFQRHKTATSARDPEKRTVPLGPAAVAIIDRQIGKHAWRRHVFLNDAGQPYTACVFRQRLRRWCKRVGIPPRPPYALRHTFGSLEAEADINQTVLAQIMGHSQLRTTSRYIAHNAEHHRKAIGAISGRILKASQGSKPESNPDMEKASE